MAVGILDQLIEKHPNTESLLLLEIECLVMEQQKEKAIDACKKLLDFRPGSAQAAIRLVRLLLGDSKFDETAEIVAQPHRHQVMIDADIEFNETDTIRAIER